MIAVVTYPPARSFRPRSRRLSAERERQYLERRERWSFTAESMPDAADVVLDIGFGRGEALIALAGQRVEGVIGVEVHKPGIVNVLEAIAANGWQHVRIFEGDVLELLPAIPSQRLAGVRLFFPDPWPKRKQRHRRLVRADVIAQLVDCVRVGGTLHVATDSTDYAAQVRAVCAAESRLRGGVVPRPEWRPVTRFERRGLADGRLPIDLIYERVS